MPHPSHFTPCKETRYPLYRRLGGPEGQSGQVQKISPPLGFDPWTLQPVATIHTNYTIPALPKETIVTEILLQYIRNSQNFCNSQFLSLLSVVAICWIICHVIKQKFSLFPDDNMASLFSKFVNIKHKKHNNSNVSRKLCFLTWRN
jgi:hypothetical protein